MRRVLLCWPKMAMKLKRYDVPDSLFSLASGFLFLHYIYFHIVKAKSLNLIVLTSLVVFVIYFTVFQ